MRNHEDLETMRRRFDPIERAKAAASRKAWQRCEAADIGVAAAAIEAMAARIAKDTLESLLQDERTVIELVNKVRRVLDK